MDEISVKEMCEVMSHIERKVNRISGIPDSETEEKIYRDIYRLALRESGAYSVESLNPNYLYAIHEAIDCYEIPAYIEERINYRNENRKDDSTICY